MTIQRMVTRQQMAKDCMAVASTFIFRTMPP